MTLYLCDCCKKELPEEQDQIYIVKKAKTGIILESTNKVLCPTCIEQIWQTIRSLEKPLPFST